MKYCDGLPMDPFANFWKASSEWANTAACVTRKPATKRSGGRTCSVHNQCGTDVTLQCLRDKGRLSDLPLPRGTRGSTDNMLFCSCETPFWGDRDLPTLPELASLGPPEETTEIVEPAASQIADRTTSSAPPQLTVRTTEPSPTTGTTSTLKTAATSTLTFATITTTTIVTTTTTTLKGRTTEQTEQQLVFYDFRGQKKSIIKGIDYRCCCRSNVLGLPRESDHVYCELAIQHTTDAVRQLLHWESGCKQLVGPSYHSWNNMPWKYNKLAHYGTCAVRGLSWFAKENAVRPECAANLGDCPGDE